MFEDAGAEDAWTPSNFTGYWNGPNDPYNEANLGGVNVPINTNLANNNASLEAALAGIGVGNVNGITGNQIPVSRGNGYGGYGSTPGTLTNTNNTANSSVSDAGTFVLSETSLDMHCWGQNPVVVAKLQLNGQDRFSEREGSYFSWVQPFQCHTRAPDEGINIYSFALRPEEHQPSGTCNFSRIDNATLQLVLSNATVEGTKTAKVRVYATNYNVLRIMSGMGGLAYSN